MDQPEQAQPEQAQPEQAQPEQTQPEEPQDLPTPNGLPESVQRRLAAWAAESLASLPADRVPVALRRVSRFAPAKRARAGFGPLLTTLATDPVFRAHVADYARQSAGRNSTHRTAGSRTATSDELAAHAAQAFLLHLPALPQLLAAAASADQSGALNRRIDELTVAVERSDASRVQAEAERDALSAELSARGGRGPAEADLEKLRGRLREQGTSLRELKDRLAGQAAEAVEELESLRRDLLRSRAEVRALQERLEASRVRGNRAAAALQAMAEESAAGQQAADRRVALLLEMLEEGVSGLRQQLRLRHGGPDPADAVADQLPMSVRANPRTADAALLAEWLTLPRAHLIVDGYNISKTGYPTMTLADQRERLVRELAAAAARTSCDVTVVFDGAAVVAPQSRVRGVRVIFSPPGVIADEVIRRLVVAEPIGRVLIVATADKEILDAVVGHGARTVAPAVLLSFMST